MKIQFVLLLCFCIMAEVTSQDLLNVYSVANNPDMDFRVDDVTPTSDGGMLLCGRLKDDDTWVGLHVTQIDAEGVPVWSTHVDGYYITGAYETDDGGVAFLFATPSGRSEMLLLDAQGTVTKRVEYGFQYSDGSRGRVRLESVKPNAEGNLVIGVFGQRETHDYVGGNIIVDPIDGIVLDKKFWGVTGMRRPSRIKSKTTDVIFAAGHAPDNPDGVVAALTPDGTLLRQWRLRRTMGEYGEHYQIGRKLLLLEFPKWDLSTQIMLLDADQDSLVWSLRIPLFDTVDPEHRFRGQMLPNFVGADDDHIYLWINPNTPAPKAAQFATMSIHDGSLISVEQQAAGISSSDVLNNRVVRAGGRHTSKRWLFSFSDSTGATTFQQGLFPPDQGCASVLEPTDDYTPVEPLTVKQTGFNLTTVPVDMVVTATEKSLDSPRPRQLSLKVQNVCDPQEEENEEGEEDEDDEEDNEDEPIIFSLSVFPNPTTSVFMVEITAQQPRIEFDLELHDLRGRSIAVQRENLANGLAMVSLNDLPTGMYLVTVIVDGERFVERIIKQ